MGNIEKEDNKLHLLNGEIIPISSDVYQVVLFSEPNRKIFTTSIDRAYRIILEANKNKDSSSQNNKKLVIV